MVYDVFFKYKIIYNSDAVETEQFWQ